VLVEVIAQFLFIFLHIHNHLEIVEFLSAPQIIDCIDERLLAHGNDLLANVLNYILFELLVFVFLLFLFFFIAIFFLNIRVSKLPKELLILLMDTILLFLNSLDDLTLSF
jgi:hypothetical protein